MAMNHRGWELSPFVARFYLEKQEKYEVCGYMITIIGKSVRICVIN